MTRPEPPLAETSAAKSAILTALWHYRQRGWMRFSPTAVCVPILLAAAGLVSGQSRPAAEPSTRPADAPTQKAPNPHWTTQDCFVCHARAADGGIEPIPLDRINDLCWTCHDGKRAHQEVHPVARSFTAQGLKQPPDWPVPQGQLSCITCHTFGKGHARGGPRPQRNAWMLRDYAGGSLSEWCAKCHTVSPAQKMFNPHRMLDSDGKVDARNCLLCHKVTEGLDRKVRLGKPDLVADPIPLCVRCHTRHIDYFTPGHIGATVPPAMKAYMLTREDATSSGPLNRETADQTPGRSREPQQLPLGLNDRVVCSTCHNPHEAGLFPPDSNLSTGAMKIRIEKDSPPSLRGLGRGICRGCHNP